jgi:fluoroacetyl-CoA thioesterase
MRFDLSPGLTSTLERFVRPEDTASRYGASDLEVLATPQLVAFVEFTALSLVQPRLPEEYGTVGMSINLKHLKPTPVGMKVSCTVNLVEVDQKRLVFEFRAQDEEGLIGTGMHERYIIHTESFTQRLVKK